MFSRSSSQVAQWPWLTKSTTLQPMQNPVMLPPGNATLSIIQLERYICMQVIRKIHSIRLPLIATSAACVNTELIPQVNAFNTQIALPLPPLHATAHTQQQPIHTPHQEVPNPSPQLPSGHPVPPPTSTPS